MAKFKAPAPKAPAVMKVPGRGSLPAAKRNPPFAKVPSIANGATVPMSGAPKLHPNRMKFPTA